MRPISVIAGLVFGLLASSIAVAHDDAVASGVRAYSRQQYVLASELLQSPAQLGDPLAQTYLGFMYQEGRGVPRDYEVAAHWFRAAADQGQPTAQFFLGLLYDKGFGVRRDFVDAEKWLNLAAAHANNHDRDYWARMRDAVAGKLTIDELREARARSLAFTPIEVR
jgi:TPR repeat protein